jgi:hypothetical protein
MSQQQLFFSIPSPDLLWVFLLKYGEEHNNKFYIFSKTHYKKALFYNSIQPFIKQLEPYYYESKKHYVNRKMDYNKFVTIIRQICNCNAITYEKKMIYNNSTYEIEYHIYKNTYDKINASQ